MHLMEHERTVHAGIHDAGRTAVGPAHVARLDEAERVVDAERRQNSNVPGRFKASIFVLCRNIMFLRNSMERQYQIQ